METKEMVKMLRRLQRLNKRFDTYEKRGAAQNDIFWVQVGDYYSNAYDEGDEAMVMSNNNMFLCIVGSLTNVAHALTRYANRHGITPKVKH